jgi:hypothetical protein
MRRKIPVYPLGGYSGDSILLARILTSLSG